MVDKQSFHSSISVRRATMNTRSPLAMLASAAALIVLALVVGTTTAADTTASSTDEFELVTSIEVNLPVQKRRRRKKTSSAAGEDQHEQCPEWAAQGECEANPGYMLESCAASCSPTDEDEEEEDEPAEVIPKGRAFVYQGDDAAIGAFRFAEQYSSYYTNEVMPTAAVLDLARKLQWSISDRKSVV